MEFRDEIGQAVLEKCLAEGLLINRVRPNTIRLMPPLVITRDEIDNILSILERVLSGF